MHLTRYTDHTGARYYITPDGLHVPSVTTVLRPPGSHRNEAMEVGATRGSRLHACIEAYAAGRPVSPSLDAADYWERLEPWLHANVVGWLAQEHTVWCDRYAGTLDAVCRVRGHGRVLLDWKTSSKPVRRKGTLTKWGPQLGAYARCYEGDLDAVAVAVIYATEMPDVWVYSLDEVETVTCERFDAALRRWYGDE